MDFIWLPVLQLTVIEGRLIITGYSMGGSVASLFTLCLLEVINLSKPKCRPICITFGSPLIGGFGLQHSMWNSFFLHVVSNQDPVPGLFLPFTNYRLQALWDISLVLWTWLCLFWQLWFNFGIAESHIIRGCQRIAGCWLQEDFKKPQGEGNLQGTSAGGWKVCKSIFSWDHHGTWDDWI